MLSDPATPIEAFTENGCVSKRLNLGRLFLPLIELKVKYINSHLIIYKFLFETSNYKKFQSYYSTLLLQLFWSLKPTPLMAG